MPEKKVLSARFQASFLMDNILSEKRLLADLNLNLIMQNLSAADRARSHFQSCADGGCDERRAGEPRHGER